MTFMPQGRNLSRLSPRAGGDAAESGPDSLVVQSLPLSLYNKLRGFSPPANYTDRATDACRRS
jgi:hypothetical protein